VLSVLYRRTGLSRLRHCALILMDREGSSPTARERGPRSESLSELCWWDHGMSTYLSMLASLEVTWRSLSLHWTSWAVFRCEQDWLS